MKKIILVSIIGIVCMAFIKVNKTIVDYREIYVGTYSCQQVCYQKSTEQGKAPIASTNTLAVNVSKDAIDSVLLFQIDGRNMKFKLAGTFINCVENGLHGGGKFYSTDSLKISLSMGRANSCKFIGKKKS